MLRFRCLITLFFLLFLQLFIFAACEAEEAPPVSSSSSSSSASPTTYTWTDNFDSFNTNYWRKFDNFSWGNNLSFLQAYNVTYSGGIMNMRFVKNDSSGPWVFNGVNKYHSGAGIAAQQGYVYKYGRYSVRMKAARGSGLVSSFYLFRYDPWQEIDIEILGKITTKIQINVFYNVTGNGANEYHTILTNLGFDAADDFHIYMIEWESDHISWYVDGSLLYTATTQVPYLPQEVSMNIWYCDYLAWAGALFTDSPDQRVAQYDWVKYEPLGSY